MAVRIYTRMPGKRFTCRICGHQIQPAIVGLKILRHEKYRYVISDEGKRYKFCKDHRPAEIRFWMNKYQEKRNSGHKHWDHLHYSDFVTIIRMIVNGVRDPYEIARQVDRRPAVIIGLLKKCNVELAPRKHTKAQRIRERLLNIVAETNRPLNCSHAASELHVHETTVLRHAVALNLPRLRRGRRRVTA